MYVELSYVVDEDDPIYPDNPKDVFESKTRMENGDAANTTYVHHFTHNGTHMDAPFHFDKDGKKIDQIPIEDLVYEKPFFVDKTLEPFGKITKEDLKVPDGSDLLIFRTGFGVLRAKEPATYRFMFPGFESDAAHYIRERLKSVKAVMVDFMSVDQIVDGANSGYPIHHALVSSLNSSERPVLIIEDANLEPLVGKKVKRVFVMPVKFKGLDGAPVSVVAEVDG